MQTIYQGRVEMIRAIGSALPRSRRTGVLLLAPLVVAACVERSAPAKSVNGIPIDAATAANGFLERARSLHGEPGDTLHMLRSFGDTSSFGGIDRIVVVGQKLLVLDYLMDPHLAVVDLASGRVVEHFGRNGAGPREFKQPHWGFPGRGPAEAWVFDPGNQRLSLLDLNADLDHRLKRSVNVPPETMVETPTWFGNRLVATGFFPDYTLLVMDERGAPVRRVAVDRPFSYANVRHWVALRLLNRAFFANDASGRHIAVAYQWDNRVDFFTAEGAFLGTARGPRPTKASFRIRNGRFFWNDDTEMAYWAVAASDRYVFALHAGPPGAKPLEYQPSKVHVFTWRGQFVRELALDRPVFGLTLAPDGRTLYAPYQQPDGHYLIGSWRLPANVVAG